MAGSFGDFVKGIKKSSREVFVVFSCDLDEILRCFKGFLREFISGFGVNLKGFLGALIMDFTSFKGARFPKPPPPFPPVSQT